jgi:hypothetical protein
MVTDRWRCLGPISKESEIEESNSVLKIGEQYPLNSLIGYRACRKDYEDRPIYVDSRDKDGNMMCRTVTGGRFAYPWELSGEGKEMWLCLGPIPEKELLKECPSPGLSTQKISETPQKKDLQLGDTCKVADLIDRLSKFKEDEIYLKDINDDGNFECVLEEDFGCSGVGRFILPWQWIKDNEVSNSKPPPKDEPKMSTEELSKKPSLPKVWSSGYLQEMKGCRVIDLQKGESDIVKILEVSKENNVALVENDEGKRKIIRDYGDKWTRVPDEW